MKYSDKCKPVWWTFFYPKESKKDATKGEDIKIELRDTQKYCRLSPTPKHLVGKCMRLVGSSFVLVNESTVALK